VLWRARWGMLQDAVAALPSLPNISNTCRHTPRTHAHTNAGTKGLALPCGFFGGCPQLEVLTLARCALTEFPAAVLSVASLRQLSLAGNSLTALPEGITQLSRCARMCGAGAHFRWWWCVVAFRR
jgi:hypothetical protein